MCPARSALGPADQGEGYVRQRPGLLAGSGAASATDRRVRGERCTRPEATLEVMMMMCSSSTGVVFLTRWRCVPHPLALCFSPTGVYDKAEVRRF